MAGARSPSTNSKDGGLKIAPILYIASSMVNQAKNKLTSAA